MSHESAQRVSDGRQRTLADVNVSTAQMGGEPGSFRLNTDHDAHVIHELGFFCTGEGHTCFRPRKCLGKSYFHCRRHGWGAWAVRFQLDCIFPGVINCLANKIANTIPCTGT